MSLFSVDFEKLGKMMLPVKARALSVLAIVKTLLAQLAWVYEVFTIKREEHLYRVNHNGQVCKLEAVLNDRFDNVLRRIYIEDEVALLPKWMYKRVESKKTYFRRRSETAPVYMRRRSELTFGGAFVIVLPLGLSYDLAELKSLTNQYKIAGKHYSIKTI
jgi:hypothetical protein